MKTANEEVKQDALLHFFEQKYQRPISPVELLEYKNKFLQFFTLLIEIDQKLSRKRNEQYNFRNSNNSH